MYLYLFKDVKDIPVVLVPHKAVAEVFRSVKNREPTGELGCCESRTAKRRH